MKLKIAALATVFILFGCDVIDRYPEIDLGKPQKPNTENPEPDRPEPPVTEGIIPFTPADVKDPGAAYIWDESVIPGIRINVTEDEWNSFLKRYDEYHNNADFFHCNAVFTKNREETRIEDAGFRMRGNTSRRRPEGSEGQWHVNNNTDWHHCHFTINFRKYHKDEDHTVKGIRKLNLKWFKDDPCYVREMYCYDLFRRYGIWTAPFDTYCRLWIHVGGDATPAYFGVYEMIESIDEEYVERRENQFGNDRGFLWKCVYGEGGMADLRSADDWKFQYDRNDGRNYTYEFKGDKEYFATAREQFRDFILKLNGKSHDSFYSWIKSVCDVELLLKTYAVNVAVGMWDDHWCNGNNFYLYFNSTDKYDYKVFFLQYDYDNTLGTSADCGPQTDSGRHDPYKWGTAGILMERLLKYQEFREIYRNALLELTDPDNDLFHMDASVPRIKAWQEKIAPYVSNDTGEDMEIKDRPAGWSNHGEYRLMDTGKDNFFRVKTEVINQMQ